MESVKKTENRYRRISGSWLKLIALVTMLIDHIGVHLLANYEPALKAFLTLGSYSLTLYSVSRTIGRTAFPIYCFLISEGYLHTRDRKRYGIRLLVFALISELPWNLVHTGSLRYEKQNVFFTLFLGYCCIVVYECFRNDRKKLFLCLLGLLAAALLIHADYGIRGMALVLILHLLREERILQGVLGCCILNEGAATIPAFLLTGLYNGERGFIRGKILKYLFYAFYPLHLFILYYLKMHYFGS